MSCHLFVYSNCFPKQQEGSLGGRSKNISTNNDQLRPNCLKQANNGRIVYPFQTRNSVKKATLQVMELRHFGVLPIAGNKRHAAAISGQSDKIIVWPEISGLPYPMKWF
jgi:hypothetical protein